MAQRTEVILIDDLDGEEISRSGQTVSFGFEGIHYTIDLSDKNVEKLNGILAPYISAARKSGNKRSSEAPKAPIDRAQLTAIREWGKQHGFKVSDRGRVSQEVHDAYNAAH
jgi:Lsr2